MSEAATVDEIEPFEVTVRNVVEDGENCMRRSYGVQYCILYSEVCK